MNEGDFEYYVSRALTKQYTTEFQEHDLTPDQVFRLCKMVVTHRLDGNILYGQKIPHDGVELLMACEYGNYRWCLVSGYKTEFTPDQLNRLLSDSMPHVRRLALHHVRRQ